MEWNSEQIQQWIPHRPPMLLVDRVLEQEGERIVCEKTYRDDEHFVQGHYPGFPIVPGVILCETALQAGAILLAIRGAAGAGGVPVVTRIDGVRLKRMVRPGETVVLEVSITESVSTAWYLAAKIRIGSATVARLDFACTMVADSAAAPGASGA